MARIVTRGLHTFKSARWPRQAGRALAVAAALTLGAASTADAQTFGSNLRQPANAGFGCESVPTFDVFTGAPTLAPSGQSTCSLRSSGRIGSLRNWSAAPADGRIVRISVRSGPNPAPLRVWIGAASTRSDGAGGGDFSCCTVRRVTRVFRPRPNRVTTRRVNLRVTRDRSGNADFFDVVGLSGAGPGTLPLHDEQTAGQFRQGSGLVNFTWPQVRRGDTRVDWHPADGLELLFRWRFRRAR